MICQREVKKIMSQEKIVIWFKKDLRISDNPALDQACKNGKIIPVLDEDDAGDFKMGKSSCWWLYQSLNFLSEKLDKKLQIFKGNSEKILEKIVKETGATSVYWNRSYEPWFIKKEKQIEKN